MTDSVDLIQNIVIVLNGITLIIIAVRIRKGGL